MALYCIDTSFLVSIDSLRLGLYLSCYCTSRLTAGGHHFVTDKCYSIFDEEHNVHSESLSYPM